MEEPEGNRRRSAIAHLRAAVAATKADRLLGFGKKTEVEEEPYREDLADAVRPRRPKVTEARSARPAPVRPAPLKLVAEQRIDVDAAPESVEPVRPRRVLRTAEAVDPTNATHGDDTGFAEFAESQGAHTLAELLEAAAAYMSFVEGRDQFSRPQLMTKLHQAEGAASSREERLRSFGSFSARARSRRRVEAASQPPTASASSRMPAPPADQVAPRKTKAGQTCPAFLHLRRSARYFSASGSGCPIPLNTNLNGSAQSIPSTM